MPLSSPRHHRGSGLLLAGVLSLGVHGGTLALLLWPRGGAHAAPGPEALVLWTAPTPEQPREEPTWISLAPAALALPEEIPPQSDHPRPFADSTSHAEVPTAPRLGATPLPSAAAPDSGLGTGRAVAAAWRPDRSTLRARLTDGANLYQPSHARTAARASSPQALRREPVIGTKDSARKQRLRQEQLAPVEAPPPADQAEDTDLLATAPPAPGAFSTPDPGQAAQTGEGPLDADKGARSFDVAQEGAAKDVVATRAASNESHPGLIDFSTASAAGPREGTAGRGPGERPGAVPHPSAGAAPATTGVQVTVSTGADTRLDTLERPYSREHLEIRRRVTREFRFPKRLALLLEQGETVVRFLVQANGRIAGGIQVVKSAGFSEFDQEAVSMVERAAPFPAMPRPLLVTMPIAFENPVVR